MKFKIQIDQTTDVLQKQGNAILYQGQQFTFDQVQINKNIYVANIKPNSQVTYYTNIISEENQLYIFKQIAQYSQTPILVKIYQLNYNDQKQPDMKLHMEKTFSTFQQLQQNFTQLQPSTNYLIKINNINLLVISKFDVLKDFQIHVVYENLYQVLANTQNNEIKTKKLPDVFIAVLKRTPETNLAVIKILKLFSQLRLGILSKLQKAATINNQNNELMDDNIQQLIKQSPKLPTNRSFSGYHPKQNESPELQKEINDQLVLALNEAHQRIKQLNDQKKSLSESVRQSPIGKTQSLQINKQQLIFEMRQKQQLKKLENSKSLQQNDQQTNHQVKKQYTKAPNQIDISPKIENEHLKISQTDIVEIKKSLSKSKPTLEDLSQIAIDNDEIDKQLFDEYNVENLHKQKNESCNQLSIKQKSSFNIQKQDVNQKQREMDEVFNSFQNAIETSILEQNEKFLLLDSQVQTDANNTQQTALIKQLQSPLQKLNISISYDEERNDIIINQKPKNEIVQSHSVANEKQMENNQNSKDYSNQKKQTQKPQKPPVQIVTSKVDVNFYDEDKTDKTHDESYLLLQDIQLMLQKHKNQVHIQSVQNSALEASMISQASFYKDKSGLFVKPMNKLVLPQQVQKMLSQIQLTSSPNQTHIKLQNKFDESNKLLQSQFQVNQSDTLIRMDNMQQQIDQLKRIQPVQQLKLNGSPPKNDSQEQKIFKQPSEKFIQEISELRQDIQQFKATRDQKKKKQCEGLVDKIQFVKQQLAMTRKMDE